MSWNPSVQPGAHKHSDRNNDFYQTPPEAVSALLKTGELTSKVIWEPACGAGAISQPLGVAGYHVVSTDKYDQGFGTTGEQWDFLAVGPQLDWTSSAIIVTNPPFKHADAFVLRALEHCDKAVMLLRWAYAEGTHGGSRRDYARSTIMDRHCSRVYLFKERLPMMHREGYTGKKNDRSALPHAWFVFERTKQHTGFVTHRISWKDAVGKAQAKDQDQPKPASVRAV
jgi:hypothetical protein